MALFDDVLEGWGMNVLIGVGIALAAPIILPAMATVFRPIAKTLIKGYFAVADAVWGVTEGTV